MKIFKLSITTILILFLTSCLTDIIEPSTQLVDIKDIETLTKDIKLNKSQFIKDTIDFPIVNWNEGFIAYPSVELYTLAKKAGFNYHHSSFSSLENLLKALDNAEKVGIKIIFTCPELRNDPKGTIERIKNHPAVGGYIIKDEPHINEVENLKNKINSIRDFDINHFCYVNLLPNYAVDSWGTENYTEYLKRFFTELPLEFLSFDHYPIINKTIRFNWYENLKIFSKEAKKVNKPFWAFALTLPHNDYPSTDLNQLRLQVYSNLAYGAKGIQYYQGVLESHKEISDSYNYVKDMNNEINALSYIFLSAEIQNVYHYGSDTPIGTEKLISLPPYLKKLEIRGGNALLSHLKNESNTFIMIQNTNLIHDIGVKIDFNSKSNIVLKNGSIIPTTFINEEFKLIPGDIALFML